MQSIEPRTPAGALLQGYLSNNLAVSNILFSVTRSLWSDLTLCGPLTTSSWIHLCSCSLTRQAHLLWERLKAASPPHWCYRNRETARTICCLSREPTCFCSFPLTFFLTTLAETDPSTVSGGLSSQHTLSSSHHHDFFSKSKAHGSYSPSLIFNLSEGVQRKDGLWIWPVIFHVSLFPAAVVLDWGEIYLLENLTFKQEDESPYLTPSPNNLDWQKTFSIWLSWVSSFSSVIWWPFVFWHSYSINVVLYPFPHSLPLTFPSLTLLPHQIPSSLLTYQHTKSILLSTHIVFICILLLYYLCLARFLGNQGPYAH